MGLLAPSSRLLLGGTLEAALLAPLLQALLRARCLLRLRAPGHHLLLGRRSAPFAFALATRLVGSAFVTPGRGRPFARLLRALPFRTLSRHQTPSLLPSLSAPRGRGSLLSQRGQKLRTPLALALLGGPRVSLLACRMLPPLFGTLRLPFLLELALRLLREPLAPAPFRALRLPPLPTRLRGVHRNSSRAAAVVAASVAASASRSLAEASGFVTIAFTNQTRERVPVRYG